MYKMIQAPTYGKPALSPATSGNTKRWTCCYKNTLILAYVVLFCTFQCPSITSKGLYSIHSLLLLYRSLPCKQKYFDYFFNCTTGRSRNVLEPMRFLRVITFKLSPYRNYAVHTYYSNRII